MFCLAKNKFSCIILFCLIFTILSPNITFALWQQTNGPEGGEIRSMAINNDTIFAGAFWGGLYRSTNKGKIWEIIAFEEERINQIKTNKNKVFVATGNKLKNGGLYFSKNNGQSWEKLLDKTVLSFDLLGNTIIAATISSELLLSSNFGKTWVDLNFPGGLVYSILFQEERIIVGTESNGIYVSTDLGESWVQKNNGLNCLIIWCITQKDSIIFIGTGGGGIFSSTNYGENWNAKNSGILHPYVLTIDFVDTIAFAGTVGGGLYMSLNFGNLWFKTNLSYESIMSFVSDGKNIFVGTKSSGIYFSSNRGDTWVEINSGIRKSEVLCLATKGDTIFAGTNGGGLHFSTNLGKNWLRTAYSIRNPYISSIACTDTAIYVGTLGSGLFFKTKNSEIWIQSKLNTFEITAILPYKDFLFVGTNHKGLFVMNRFADSILKNKFPGETITAICRMQEKIYIAFKSGGIAILTYPYNEVEEIKLKGISINALETSNNNIFAGSDDGKIFISTDKGETWKIAASNNSGYVRTLKAVNSNIIGCWTLKNNTSWIIFSQDEGTTWGVRNDGLVDKNVTSFAFIDTLIFSGTLGFSVYKTTLKDLLSVNDDNPYFSQSEFEIIPNPTKEEIIVTFKMHQENFNYTAKIFNIFGQSFFYQINNSNCRINISALPRGIYFIQIGSKTKVFLKI